MLDANNLPDQQQLTAQLCIVGGGGAGIALALELIGSGIQVLLLEAGSIEADAGNARPSAVANGKARPAGRPDGATARSGAGTATRRGVRCQALSPAELATRAHVADSGWPVSADAMAAFYERALGICESPASINSARHDEITLAKPLLDGLGAEPFSATSLDRYAAPETLARRYEYRLAAAANICRIGNAQVTAIHLDASGQRVERLTVRTSGQRTLHVRAGTVVLAAGTQASVRLLLASRDVHGNGIGNAFGNVGRYCMSPLRGTIGTVRVHQAPVAIWHGPRNRQRSRRPLQLAPDSQRRLRLPAFAMRLRPIATDDYISTALARLGRGSGFGYSYRLNWHAEHYPVAACRLLLGDELDRDGLPPIALDWHTGDAETSGVRRALSLFDEALRKSGIGRFDHDPGALAALMNVGDQPSGPIVGGARMGSHPRYSVTDADGRVHDVDNLYVTGTAVFPTSGLDNPLLTVAALSFRLADHLKQREQARPARLCSLPQPGEASAAERAARA